MKEILNQLFSEQKLSREQAKEVLVDIASAKYPATQVAAFLAVFRMRPVSPEELSGFRDAMLELAVQVDLSQYDAIDLCGTGGDGKNTFNISTLCSFVVAGSGVNVSKHGNYGVSSVCGSSNVLEYLGIEFAKDEAGLRQQLDTAGICFLHAPLFHPAMKHVAPIRKELGVSTFFNMLGPIVNPSRPKKQIIGVYSLELARLYNEVLKSGDQSYALIHSLDGYDEVSLTGDVNVLTREEDKNYSPGDLGLELVKPEEIHGGDSVEEAGEIFTKIISGEGSKAQNEVVIANAAFAIRCACPDKSIVECVSQARESLESGKAKSVLTKLVS